MKKYFLSFAILLGMVGLLRPETLSTPLDNTGNALQNADYGGYAYSTGAFTVNYVTATVFSTSTVMPFASGVFRGVIFSSALSNDNNFVDVFDATSVVNAAAIGPFVRVYNNNYDVNGSTISSGLKGSNLPIRFKNGLIWRASTAVMNLITVLFNKN